MQNTKSELLLLYKIKRTELQLASDRGYRLPKETASRGFHVKTEYNISSQVYQKFRNYLISRSSIRGLSVNPPVNRTLLDFLTVKYPEDVGVRNDFFDTLYNLFIDYSKNMNTFISKTIINTILDYDGVSTNLYQEVDEDLLDILNKTITTKDLRSIGSLMNLDTVILKNNPGFTQENVEDFPQ